MGPGPGSGRVTVRRSVHSVHRTCCAATDETVSNTEEGDTAPTVARTGLTADVVTNVPGQQLCQGTGGGRVLSGQNMQHCTGITWPHTACTTAHTGTRRHFDISNRNHARIQEYKMTHHDT